VLYGIAAVLPHMMAQWDRTVDLSLARFPSFYLALAPDS